MSTQHVDHVTNKIVATIANGASASQTIDLAGAEFVGLILPSAWTAADITFDAMNEATSGATETAKHIYDDGGTEVKVASAAVVADRAIAPASVLNRLAPFRRIQIRSGIFGAFVNQGGQRDIIVLTK